MHTTDDPIHLYPNTSIQIVPGDLLYSHKVAYSSFLVGHEAIIGMNYRIYHVNRWGNIGHSDSMPIYLSRHKPLEKLTILRFPDADKAKNAAKWAMLHIDRVEKYTFDRDLDSIENNYCSKYIWQAYYFGNNQNFDLYGRDTNPIKRRYVTPSQLYRKFEVVGSFRNTLYR
ncbi:hypothetical protein [Oceanobacillus bengalensis]|uniref:Permuted papain-like amidase enzyme, YaeF/YiiX, C92 family n=2 Tax=Oceanobacillus bengalensis TaxID=1435466 RepID=A0A494YYK0_9BACI|nr:hypothetical protein D8M05_11020 [Oceanobacillus bengalensis]